MKRQDYRFEGQIEIDHKESFNAHRALGLPPTQWRLYTGPASTLLPNDASVQDITAATRACISVAKKVAEEKAKR